VIFSRFLFTFFLEGDIMPMKKYKKGHGE